MTNTRKALHVLATIALLAMSALQWNDPDPIFWSIVYLLPALAPLARITNRRSPVLYSVSNGMLLAGLSISLPGFIDFVQSGDYASITAEMTEQKPYVESGREFLGLVIAATCHACYGRWHLRATR